MTRISRNTRHSKYVIRLVCEGKKTEPLFFTSLCDVCFSGRKDIDVKPIPQPDIPEDEDTYNPDRGEYKGKRRRTKSETTDNEEITGVPPLKWVLYARQIMSEGVDEAWAVYDKDKHPKHKEAFSEANKVIDGKKVNIAFSSRSFEYYLLLHFEYIYHSFKETECGEKIRGKKHIFECGTGKNPEKDCNGENCINGYARKRGYWQETKSSVSTFPLVKDNLLRGIINACRLRAESDAKTREPVYDRNPYTDVDILICRLIGKETVKYGETFSYHEHGCNWSVRYYEDTLTITNNKNGNELFPQNTFALYDYNDKTICGLNKKALLLQPGESIKIPCKAKPHQIVSIRINPEKEVLLLPDFARHEI